MILFTIVVVLSFVMVYFEAKVSPFMSEYTKMKSEQRITELFSDAVNQKMSDLDLTYDKMMNITYSKTGEVQSLNTNVFAVNKLKNEVTSELSQELAQKVDFEIEIPIGSIINTEFLSGSGKSLIFNNTVTGDVQSSFRSEFESCGINQTIHRLYIDLTGKLLVVCGGEQIPIKLTVPVLVGETVLVGHVPSMMNSYQ